MIQQLTRRSALLGLTAAVTLGRASLALGAADTDRRLVVVILRGALDGLAAVVPYGEATLAGWRAPLVPPAPGQPNGLLDLGGMFGLHPSLAGLHDLYAAGDALPIHAVASSDRSRSHFKAQDTLELGTDQSIRGGWLNRVAGLLPRRGQSEDALAVAAIPPLLLRGPAPVGSWLPLNPQHPPPDYYAQLAALHAPDRMTGGAIAVGLRERGFTEAVLAGVAAPPNRMAFPSLCDAAGRLLAANDGPRVAALEAEGWDTHAHQAPRLANALKNLDAGLVALKAALGDGWSRTAVLVVTEFGRTVRINGTDGTDHGTGTVAFVLGGAVAGGRVAGDWPGLAESRLFENRDLQPTTDVRSVAKGLLAQHLGLDRAALETVFPGSALAPPMRGLLRTQTL
jgi:uncharacterized protein (DUF1501 family)